MARRLVFALIEQRQDIARTCACVELARGERQCQFGLAACGSPYPQEPAMNFRAPTYEGPPIDDPDLLARLPGDLRQVLDRCNGFILCGGGFHLRGACREPHWHSLANAWSGSLALSRLFPAVQPEDVPFAQDFLGDQYLLRDGAIWLLRAETGALTALPQDLASLLDAIERDPVAVLGLAPLLAFEADGGLLRPGQLLSAYPPFCTRESASGVSLRAVSCADRLLFLAEFAAQVASVPDGAAVKVTLGSQKS
jgi:hypothetical protein